MNPLRIRLKEHSGTVAIVFALLLPVLIGMLGIIIDLGYAYQYRRIMQTAADGAAMGGAYSIFRDDSNQSDNIEKAALYDAAMNGFDGSNGETRTVNFPPVGGFYAGEDGYVEVIISRQLPTYFMPVLGIYDMTISARAVAGVTAAIGCLFVLNGTKDKALDVASASTLTALDCRVKVASCSTSNALSTTSLSTINFGDIDVCGNYECSSGSTCNPTPDTGECDGTPCERGLDPLEDLNQPVPPAGCDQTDFKVNSLGSVGTRHQIWPGTYCNGLNVESGSHVNFNPGMYYLKGGGLKIQSDSTAEGFGVTFFNTEGGGGTNYEPIFIQNNNASRFSAPDTQSDNTFDRVLFWQDRNIVGEYDNKIESNATSYFDGILYIPTQHLQFHSNTVGEGGAGYTVIIVDTLEVSSGTTVSLGLGAGGLPVPTLVE